MRKLLIPLFISLFFMCSWVDRSTMDTYYGSIQFVESSYDVTRLSGRIEYYLTDSTNLCLDSSGKLLNGSATTLKGYALINGSEYPIQFLSNGGLQIQQEYLSNTSWRTTWVYYDLTPDIVPSSFDLSEIAPIFILFILFIFISVSITKGFIL